LGALVAIDGVNGAAVTRAARDASARLARAERGGVSMWDASGIFGDLTVAGEDAGQASARTLLLLYAADLAFRLRWEIRPKLESGRSVVAAPYIATAVSFGRAAGLDEAWLTNLFNFAPPPTESRAVTAAPARNGSRDGFVELACETICERKGGPKRKDVLKRARTFLRAHT